MFISLLSWLLSRARFYFTAAVKFLISVKTWKEWGGECRSSTHFSHDSIFQQEFQTNSGVYDLFFQILSLPERIYSLELQVWCENGRFGKQILKVATLMWEYWGPGGAFSWRAGWSLNSKLAQPADDWSGENEHPITSAHESQGFCKYFDPYFRPHKAFFFLFVSHSCQQNYSF